MRKKSILRLISLAMLAAAAVFLCCALSCPTLGTTICIGSFVFGAEQWRVCYLIYILAMLAIFISSFFVKEEPRK